MTNARSPLRTLRAAMFAALCVTLAAVGHAAMSGHDIPLPVLLAAFAVTGAVAWCAAGRRRGLAAIAGGQVAAQGALHLLFARTRPMRMAGMPGMAPAPASELTPMPMPMPTMTCGARYAHLMPDVPDGQAMRDMHAMADMPGMAGESMTASAGRAHALAMDAAAHSMSGGMLAAHLVAALICGVWLWRGEAAAFRLARTVGALGVLAARPLRRVLRLVRLHVPAPPRPVRAPRPHHRPRPGLRGAVHSHAVIRRGPPAGEATRATAPGRPAFA
ncbi:hypothetical protein [Streptomyces xanthochromogenes]|uniref:Integral membrane protein n=1 Tax=Streptomyces xanthochromogenes TaxID=67384 RepID=A0ABQ2ZT61_9ACTN|nr:hypothetical protein [Streptomyces xanthochromogenes]GGY24402.1 hypothetical protein GCM10010326_17600 [Streptomyces xanthochromogenes]